MSMLLCFALIACASNYMPFLLWEIKLMLIIANNSATFFHFTCILRFKFLESVELLQYDVCNVWIGPYFCTQSDA